MADLNDLWNWPNNSANGYATDSNDWSGDASFGIDKRVDDVRTYTYKPHQTGNLNYSDLGYTTDQLNLGFAAYKNYAHSFGDDTNPTFNQLAKYPIVEWSIQPNGRTIAGIHYELNSNNMPRIRVQFTHAHEFANGEQIEFFGFAPDTSGRDDKGFNTIQPYVEIIDGFNVVLYEDSALTKLQEIAEPGFVAQNDIFFTTLDQGTGNYQGALLHFDVGYETFSDGDVLQIADTFTNMGAGTLASASSGTLIYLERYDDSTDNFLPVTGSNTYKIYSDQARTTPFTITSGQGKDEFSTEINYSVASSGSDVNLSVDISDSSFATLRGEIESQNMTPDTQSEDDANIFRGFCRVSLDQPDVPLLHAGVTKAVQSTLNDFRFYGYKYTKSSGLIEISTDPTMGARDVNPLTLRSPNSSITNCTGKIKIIDFWSYRNESPGTFGTGNPGRVQTILPASGTNVGGLLWTGAVSDTGLQTVTPLTHPLASETGTLYSGTKSTNDDNENFDKLIYQLQSTNTRSPGRRKYQYQDTNNATQNGAVYDFTKFWRPGATSAFTPTYLTTPTGTPDLSAQGYLDGTNQLDTFPQRGLFTLAGLGLTSSTDVFNNPILSGSPAKPSSHIIEKIGIFPINAKADEYVAPTPYAPDVFDTDDEWIDPDFSTLKVWPKDPVPSNIRFTVNQPTSVTRSQSGVKYARTSGVVRYQMEVEYPVMTYDQFREFEVIAQAAQGQSMPFYFDIKNYTKRHGGTANLFYQRQDSANSSINTSQLRFKESTTAGQKTLLVEGFQANISDVFIRGEVCIGPSNGNGNFYQVLNDNITSNKYGEAKIRFPYGFTKARDADVSLYKNPSHVVVTLAEDSFEYTLGADGFYRVSFRFDFDEFK